MHDPVAGLLLTGLSSHASLVIVEGEVLVEHGTATRLDVGAVAARAHAAVPPLPPELPTLRHVGKPLRIEAVLEPRGPAAAIVLTDAQVEGSAPRRSRSR